MLLDFSAAFDTPGILRGNKNDLTLIYKLCMAAHPPGYIQVPVI